MSYLVLARKYRPHNFDEMVGQEHVVQALSNALAQKRLHHAYLFTGTRGVGKTTVSRILAKSLNCQGTDGQGDITAHPCGVCQACQDIDAGRFVDYTELDAASNRGVEEVQSLMEQAVYKPVQGRFKVFMIDEVHMLSNTAFNAMLKTLEEPPEYLKFVLATTDPQKVPVTVLSRCLQFNLRPMAPATIVEHLERVLGQEGVAQDRAALQLLARAARGSMRDALSLTDQAIAYGNGALEEATVRQMLGVVDKRYVFDAIAALAAGDGRTVVALADTLRQQGIPAASLLEDMALALQKMALCQSLPAQEQEGLDEADAQRIRALAATMPADETQLLYTFCLKGREELGLAPDEYAGLVMVLLRLLAFKLPPGSSGAAGAGGVPPPVSSAPSTPSSASPAPPTEPSSAPSPGPTPAGQEVGRAHHAGQGAPVVADAAAPPMAADVGDTMPPAPVAVAAISAAAPASSAASSASVVFSAAAVATAPASSDQSGQPGTAAPLPWEEVRAGTAAQADVATESVTDSVINSAQAEAVDAMGEGMPAAVPDVPDVPEVPAMSEPPSAAFAASAGSAVTEPARPVALQAVTASAQPQLATPQGDTAWWHATVQGLIEQGRLTSLVRELALQAQLQRRDAQAGTVVLRVANRSLINDSLHTKLQDVLRAAGVAGTLVLEQGAVSASLAQQLEADKLQAQQLAQAIVEADARVQWLQQHWGAQIVPGSVKPLAIAVR